MVAEGVTDDPRDFNDMGIGQVVVSGGVSNVAITIMEQPIVRVRLAWFRVQGNAGVWLAAHCARHSKVVQNLHQVLG